MVFLVMSAFVAVLVQQYRIQIQKRADREKHKEQLACTMAFVLLQLAQERRGKSDFDEKKYLEQEAQQENRLVDRYFCERLAKIWTPQVDIKEVRVMFGIRLRIDLPTFLEFCQTHALYMKESRYESLKEKQREKAEWIQYVESKIKNNQTRKFLIYADAALVLALTVLVSFDSFSIGAAIALFSFQIVSFSGLFMLEFVSHEPADWRSVYDIVLIVCTILVASIGAASSSSKILHVGFSFPILRLITVQDRIRNFEDGDEASNPPAKGDNFQLVRTFAPFLMHLLVLLMIVVTSFSFLFTMVFPNAEDDTLSLQTQPFRTTTNSLMSGFQILTTSNWHLLMFPAMQAYGPIASWVFCVMFFVLDFVLVNIVVAIFVDALLASSKKTKPTKPNFLVPPMFSPGVNPASASNLFQGVSDDQIPKRFSFIRSRSGKGYTWRGIADYQES
eukprot:TRINITY_DN39647_c0_g3_i2.p1 TRINITY_DN39647_c0_g3~~TRINITY_DN39647_c0_g3_i2.p1  ORF type:complete len:447 (-),score=121.42 TRINITY_DN39647_c0_g3_i2:106-1446(-)